MPITASLTLHPINHGFPNDTNDPMETWVFSPDHIPSLLRGEYKFIRIHGGSREVARWHCHRVISMMQSNWIAERIDDDLQGWSDFDYEDSGEDEDGIVEVSRRDPNESPDPYWYQ